MSPLIHTLTCRLRDEGRTICPFCSWQSWYSCPWKKCHKALSAVFLLLISSQSLLRLEVPGEFFIVFSLYFLLQASSCLLLHGLLPFASTLSHWKHWGYFNVTMNHHIKISVKLLDCCKKYQILTTYFQCFWFPVNCVCFENCIF